jgi:hypothetical protein
MALRLSTGYNIASDHDSFIKHSEQVTEIIDERAPLFENQETVLLDLTKTSISMYEVEYRVAKHN